MITVKNSHEQARMREAGKIVGDTLRFIEPYVKPGVSTVELDNLMENYICSRGAKPNFKHLYGFPATACISIDEEVVHGVPSERVLKEGEIVSIDVGAKIKGFNGDAARTFPVGEVSFEKRKLIEVCKDSFFKGVEQVAVGKHLGDVSHAIQSYVESFGFGIVRCMTGHGIGRALHEDPEIPNYGMPGTGPVLKEGYCLAVEPMITAGSPEVKFVPVGDWDVCVTRDLRPSAHYENTILILSDKIEILTL